MPSLAGEVLKLSGGLVGVLYDYLSRLPGKGEKDKAKDYRQKHAQEPRECAALYNLLYLYLFI